MLSSMLREELRPSNESDCWCNPLIGPHRGQSCLVDPVRTTNLPHPRAPSAPLPCRMAVLGVIAVLVVTLSLGTTTGCTRQAQVATRGAQVMPFDLDQTIHVFQRLDDGGRQTVTVKDLSNSKQIALIQSHLQHETDKFRRGDFSDPARIHGDEMPGLAKLKSEFSQIDIRYTALPNGGEIRYTTTNPSLVMALHHWFMAQVSDHGRHAVGH